MLRTFIRLLFFFSLDLLLRYFKHSSRISVDSFAGVFLCAFFFFLCAPWRFWQLKGKPQADLFVHLSFLSYYRRSLPFVVLFFPCRQAALSKIQCCLGVIIKRNSYLKESLFFFLCIHREAAYKCQVDSVQLDIGHFGCLCETPPLFFFC